MPNDSHDDQAFVNAMQEFFSTWGIVQVSVSVTHKDGSMVTYENGYSGEELLVLYLQNYSSAAREPDSYIKAQERS